MPPKSTLVTELAYRKQLRPVLRSGATTMDRLFGEVSPGTVKGVP